MKNYQSAFHLPLAADLDLIPSFPYVRSQKLLFFSGTAWPNRKLLLNTLLDQWSNTDAFDLHLVANPFVEQQPGHQRLNQTLRFEEPIAISEFGLRASNSLCTLVVGRDSLVLVSTLTQDPLALAYLKQDNWFLSARPCI